jgi:hypothetical protein
VADIAQFLSLFEHKVRQQSKLTRSEANAVTGYLCTRIKPFVVFEGAGDELRQLITHSHTFYTEGTECVSQSSTDSVDMLIRINTVQVRAETCL